MASVEVHRAALQVGALPRVCAKSGQPATTLVRMGFDTTPRGLWVLLLFGIVPYLLAALLTSERISGAVPLTEEAHRDATAATRASRRGLVAGAGLVAASFLIALTAGPSAWLVLPAVGGIVIAAGGMLTAQAATIGLQRTGDRDVVVMTRVHPRFAAAAC
jgi:hypothetical protein